MPRTNRLDRFAFGFLQNPDLLFLTKPTLLHFVLPFFFAQNSTFATSSFSVSGQEAYRIWLSLFELYRYYSWIIDRFHISTQMWHATYRGVRYKFGWLESHLAALGFRLT